MTFHPLNVCYIVHVANWMFIESSGQRLKHDQHPWLNSVLGALWTMIRSPLAPVNKVWTRSDSIRETQLHSQLAADRSETKWTPMSFLAFCELWLFFSEELSSHTRFSKTNNLYSSLCTLYAFQFWSDWHAATSTCLFSDSPAVYCCWLRLC